MWKKKLHLILFFVFSLLYAGKLRNVQLEYNRGNHVIHEDAFGYYLILPALFIHRDLEFGFLESMRHSGYVPPVVNSTENGEQVCKYYSGVALLQLPFFLGAWITAPDTGKLSGFEPHFHRFILIASAFYLLWGMYLLTLILVRSGLPPLVAGLTPFAVLFGTNLYAYATYDPAYSHVYSFFALMLFIYFLTRYREKQVFSNAMLSGLAFGLIAIIRPLNGVAILFVPVILQAPVLRSVFKDKFRNLPGFGFTAAGILSIQSIIWYLQTGRLYVYPYGDEKLNLLQPRISELIFSFDCGWAIYTPLPFLLLCISLILLVIQGKYRKAAFSFIAAFSILYLLSCWYYLHYGCTVGCRPVTEFYGPLAVLAGSACGPFLKKLSFSIPLAVLVSAFIAHNMLVQKQFFDHIINWCDMDKERYKMVFLKTHEAYKYSTSKLWNYEPFLHNPPFLNISPDSKLSIDRNQPADLVEFDLPPIDNRDSLLAVTIQFLARKTGRSNEAFLRILASDNGNYREQLRHLLRRELKQDRNETKFSYTFHLGGKLEKGRISIFLESVDGRSGANVHVQEISIRRFLFE